MLSLDVDSVNICVLAQYIWSQVVQHVQGLRQGVHYRNIGLCIDVSLYLMDLNTFLKNMTNKIWPIHCIITWRLYTYQYCLKYIKLLEIHQIDPYIKPKGTVEERERKKSSQIQCWNHLCGCNFSKSKDKCRDAQYYRYVIGIITIKYFISVNINNYNLKSLFLSSLKADFCSYCKWKSCRNQTANCGFKLLFIVILNYLHILP